LLGLWGCVPALLQVILPPPFFGRRAIFEAKACADKLVLDIKLVVGLLLHGYCEGLSALDRTRLVKYFAEMERGIAHMSRALNEAWYEPGSTRQVAQLSTVLRMVYKLRAELFGMQQALTDEQASWAACASENIGAKEQFHDMVMAQMRHPMTDLVRESLVLLTCVVSLIKSTSSDRFQVQLGAEGDTSPVVFGDLKHNLARQQIKNMIERHLDTIGNGEPAFQETKNALQNFHVHLSNLRDETKQLERDTNIERAERVEMDAALMMFLFSVTGFSQQLLDFSDEYAITMEEAQQRKSRFAADTKMVALQFQRKQLVAAVKTSFAITAAATFNATRATFNYEATAPVLIAYLMAGHVGSSYENTVSRVLGVLVGTIMSFCVLIFAQCNVYWRTLGFVFTIFLMSFVRFTSPQASYMGLSGAVATCMVLVRDWDSCGTNTELVEQYNIVRQVVLSCSLLVIAEFLIWPATGVTNLQKKISDTLTECKLCFHQLSVYNAAQYGELSAEGEKVDPKKVEMKLWDAIPAGLREQSNFLEHAKSEPTIWRTEFPASAYTRILDANIRISINMMLLRNAWRRLNNLAKDHKLRGGGLMMDQPHVKAKLLDEDDPRDRRVEVLVKVKIGNLTELRDILHKEAAAYDVWPSTSAISGRSKTEVIAQLPLLDDDTSEAQKKAQAILERLAKTKDIALQIERAKNFNRNGRTEIHVPAVRMLTRSHQDLLMAPENTDHFELKEKGIFAGKAGVAKFDSVQKAISRVKWLHSLGRNSPTENWRPVEKGTALRHMLRDELQFDFNHGNIMDHVNILSDKVQACFKSVAEDLRFNAVFDKETGHADGDAYFQTADSYYDNRKKHVSTQLRSEVGELAKQFEHALRTSLHISARERGFLPSTGDNGVDWTKRARENEDLLVFYGICKNYEALVEALLETDSVMFNGDDMNLVRNPCMLHAHAWTAQDLGSTFSPAGQGPSWYRLGLPVGQ